MVTAQKTILALIAREHHSSLIRLQGIGFRDIIAQALIPLARRWCGRYFIVAYQIGSALLSRNCCSLMGTVEAVTATSFGTGARWQLLAMQHRWLGELRLVLESEAVAKGLLSLLATYCRIAHGHPP